MPRAHVPINIVIQLDNAVNPPMYGAPVLMTSATVIIDSEGNQKYQPAHTQLPISEEDVHDDLLQALNNQLKAVGLQLQRL